MFCKMICQGYGNSCGAVVRALCSQSRENGFESCAALLNSEQVMEYIVHGSKIWLCCKKLTYVSQRDASK